MAPFEASLINGQKILVESSQGMTVGDIRDQLASEIGKAAGTLQLVDASQRLELDMRLSDIQGEVTILIDTSLFLFEQRKNELAQTCLHSKDLSRRIEQAESRPQRSLWRYRRVVDLRDAIVKQETDLQVETFSLKEEKQQFKYIRWLKSLMPELRQLCQLREKCSSEYAKVEVLIDRYVSELSELLVEKNMDEQMIRNEFVQVVTNALDDDSIRSIVVRAKLSRGGFCCFDCCPELAPAWLQRRMRQSEEHSDCADCPEYALLKRHGGCRL